MSGDHNSDFPSRVAKIGQRMPGAEPLLPVRDYLRDLARWVLIAIVLALFAVAGVLYA